MVYDSRFLYMKFPLLAPELDGKTWMKFDIRAVAEGLGIDASLVRADQQGGDPTVTLKYLRTVSNDVERVGTEKVRGVECTHYRATIDLRKYHEESDSRRLCTYSGDTRCFACVQRSDAASRQCPLRVPAKRESAAMQL